MWFHVERFIADLRQTGGWVVAIFLAALIVSILGTYMVVFAVAEGRSGTLSAVPPLEPLGFLRAIDPNDSIVMDVESVEDLDRSVLDEPGLEVLLDRMLSDDRMFIVMPFSAFTFDWRSGGFFDSEARAVMGISPPFLVEVPGDGVLLAWGSISDEYEVVAGVSDITIKGHPVQGVSEKPLTAWYVAGSGHRVDTQGFALVAFAVSTGRELGVSHPYSVSEVVDGFTCYCDASELMGLAEAMSEAESRAGTGRGFYAVTYEGVVGPVQRSRAVTETLNAGHAIGTLLAVWCLVVMVAQVFWARRSHAYLVERLCGSSEFPVQIRGQLLIVISLSLPALAGYELVNAVLRDSTWPPPLPPESRALAVAGVVVLHALAGVINAVRIHWLYNTSTYVVRRA